MLIGAPPGKRGPTLPPLEKASALALRVSWSCDQSTVRRKSMNDASATQVVKMLSQIES